MAVRLRLRRMGRKKRPFYRIVAADQRSPRDGRFIEIVGYYDPLGDQKVELKEDRIYHWLEKGAQPSDTVKSLLRQQGMLHRLNMQKLGMDEAKIEEEMKKWELLQSERSGRREAAKSQANKAAKEAAKKAAEEKAEAEKVATAAAPVVEAAVPVEEAEKAETVAAPAEEPAEAPVEAVKAEVEAVPEVPTEAETAEAEAAPEVPAEAETAESDIKEEIPESDTEEQSEKA